MTFLSSEDRRRLVAQYREGYAVVQAALEGITERELDARPAAGKWSPREIVHHLADSESVSAIRLRRLLAEHSPAIQAYDQEEYARRLFYNRPISASLGLFRFARETTADILDRLDEAQWRRAGTHSEVGGYSVDTWLQIYAIHAHNHAEQIRRARQLAQQR